ncbi:hypothetical protein ACHWQZ_G011104 [Mnemiopsis leidyi]
MKKIVLLLTYVSMVACSYKEHLNQFLHNFEELAKEKVYLENISNATVLSAMKFYVRIELESKVFHAALQPHTGLFHPDLFVKHKLKDGEKLGSVNFEEHLEGHLVDEPASRVLLHIKDNIATGSIEVSDQEKYFIEPSGKHIKEPHNFHMIAYKLSDVKFNFTKPEEDEEPGRFCGENSEKSQSGFPDDDLKFMKPETPLEEDGFQYYRRKRDATKKKLCTLALIADYKFFELHGENEGTTINYMINLIQQIDALYRQQSMDFDGSEEYKDYGFLIKYIEVGMDEEADANNPYSYKHVADTRDVSELLKYFSFATWQPDYCLAHLFTNYQFRGGVLGLAYVGYPTNAKYGGICSQVYKDPRGQFTQNLNVGLTSATMNTRTLLNIEMVIVTGHELGHNWGSSHDSDVNKECAPKDNRFMMYPAAQDGSQANNFEFSPCSKWAINKVLKGKADLCFVEEPGPICGNGLVEEGEECDQGRQQSDCCENCRLTSGSECEPINDICCGEQGSDKHCKFQKDKLCLETNWDTDKNVYCYKDYTCQINSASSKYECTPGAMLSNNLRDVCFDNGRCRDGNCFNLCEYHGKVPCLCEGEDICKQCCKDDTVDGKCETFTNPDTGTVDLLSDGKFCGNGNCQSGVCVIGAQDLQEKFWEVMDRLDVNMVLKWFRNNIVFAVILFTSVFWIPIAIFVDWLDDKYDLGYLDEILGSSNDEKKSMTRGNTMLLQERKSVSNKKSESPQYLYPKLDDTGV